MQKQKLTDEEVEKVLGSINENFPFFYKYCRNNKDDSLLFDYSHGYKALRLLAETTVALKAERKELNKYRQGFLMKRNADLKEQIDSLKTLSREGK